MAFAEEAATPMLNSPNYAVSQPDPAERQELTSVGSVASSLALDHLWMLFMSGVYRLDEYRFSDTECEIRIRYPDPNERLPTLSAKSRPIFERVLLGESQNSVAIDLGLSSSSVAGACKQALSGIAVEHRSRCTPVVLIIAAHAAHGFRFPDARTCSDRAGIGSLTLRLARPDLVLPAVLSPREQDIVRRLVGGWSTSSLAAERPTSKRTIANQLASIFQKLGVSGRGELLARVVRDHSAMWASTALTEQPGGLKRVAANEYTG